MKTDLVLPLSSSLSCLIMTQPNIFVWNCRGARKRLFASMMKDLHRKHDFSILILLETRINGDRVDKVIKKLEFDGVYRVEANDFAGGIWALWDASMWRVNILSTSTQLIHMEISPHGGGSWLLTACYGRPQSSLRSVLWNDLRLLATSVHIPWCVIGDFNVVLYDHEVCFWINF